MKEETMEFNVLDLFCGAGGLSLGFKMADFNIIGGIDFNQEALDTHKLNFKEGFHFCGDISELDDDFVLEPLPFLTCTPLTISVVSVMVSGSMTSSHESASVPPIADAAA